MLGSLKTGPEYLESGPFDPPENWLHLGNYATAFTDGGMLRGFLNTTIILVISLTGTVLIGSMAAYAIDRFDFRGKKLVVALFLVATLVPAVTTQVATFQVVNNLGLFNTRWSAIALFLGTDIISIYIFQQFLRGVPRELDEPPPSRAPGRCGSTGGSSCRCSNRPSRPWSSSRHRRLQRVLHPVPVHAVPGARRHLHVPVPVQGPFGAHWEVISPA